MILTVDSSTNIASVSVVEGGRILYYKISDEGKTHSQKLMPMIDECFKEIGKSPHDMDAFAAVSGPGSFTGLRIGIAAIQGLAYASGKECIAVGALDAMAYGAKKFNGIIVPLIDARNAQVYSAVFDGHSLKKIKQDDAGDVSQLARDISVLGSDALFIGDGAFKNRELIISSFEGNAFFLDKDENYTAALGAAVLAEKYYDAKKGVPPRELLPYYIRETSAKKKFI
jgi:tRNA threonylcarbamoyladenosine biosynthesis protein TsaB